ncbi:MAG: hypothetical protein ACJAYJ_000666 [Saprospiraceae bacterium]|jgi:hypothetical protein
MKKIGLIGLSLLFIGQAFSQIIYSNQAPNLGIDHTFPLGFLGGGGVSFYDFNQDGLDDLTLATDQGEFIHFYENTGDGFEKLFPPLVGHNDLAKQIIWVDYDNDGDKDLWVNTWSGPNRFYQNNGNMLMQEITFLAGFPINDYQHYGACWGDYNRDGWLDVYISLRTGQGQTTNENLLFKNNADGTFTNVTAISNAGDPEKKAFCAAFFDYNNDKWPDLYTANDKAAGNTLLMNNGDGTFSNDSLANANLVMDAMSVTIGDYDSDGWQDIYLSDLPNGNSLLHNEGTTAGQSTFTDVAVDAGVSLYGLSWGSNFLDADNDGDLDLYVSGSKAGFDENSSTFFRNEGNGTFFQPNAGFIGDTVSSYNNAVGDYNNDGYPDIMVINTTPHNAQLWQNDGGDANWLKIKLQGVLSNRDGVGSKIECYTNGQYQMRYTHAGYAFMGQNSDTEIIGLGDFPTVDSLHITWTTGHVDCLYNVNSNQKLTVIEGSTTNGEITVDDDIEIIGNTPPTPPTLHFSEYSDSAGINHVSKHQDFMGGGAAFFDYDKDGDDDLYLTSGRDRDQFYENQGDGTFQEIGTAAGFQMTEDIYTIGVIAGDIDNDGFKDLFITTRGDSQGGDLMRNLLFHNNGDGTFEEIWEENSSDIAFSMGANFVDVNLDGLLDIYVVNYVAVGQFLYDDNGEIAGFDHECFQNTFYQNMGNGNFAKTDIGLEDTGCALAVTSTDFDMDGDMDIYIANDFGEWIQPNKLYQNEGASFEEVAPDYDANVPMYGMGIAVGDIDEDLDFDYYVSNFGRNSLLENQQTSFEDIANTSGVDDTYIIDSLLTVGWGTAFLDIDNDMDLDLYVANGYVPSPHFLPSQLYMQDKLFINDGEANFLDGGLDYGIDNDQVARGMAYSDYDNDGDLDIVSVVLNMPIGAENGYSHLFKNNKGNEKNWLQVNLEGLEVNRDAIGSKVFLHANGRTLVREVSGGSSHASHNSPRLHFGLEDATIVDSIEVIWTGGQRRQAIYDVAVNQLIDIQEDTTIQIINATREILLADGLLKVYPNPAAGVLTIELVDSQISNIKQIEVFTNLGQRVQQLFFENKRTATIDLSSLISGMYLIKISSKKGIYLKKVKVVK